MAKPAKPLSSPVHHCGAWLLPLGHGAPGAFRRSWRGLESSGRRGVSIGFPGWAVSISLLGVFFLGGGMRFISSLVSKCLFLLEGFGRWAFLCWGSRTGFSFKRFWSGFKKKEETCWRGFPIGVVGFVYRNPETHKQFWPPSWGYRSRYQNKNPPKKYLNILIETFWRPSKTTSPAFEKAKRRCWRLCSFRTCHRSRPVDHRDGKKEVDISRLGQWTIYTLSKSQNYQKAQIHKTNLGFAQEAHQK